MIANALIGAQRELGMTKHFGSTLLNISSAAAFAVVALAVVTLAGCASSSTPSAKGSAVAGGGLNSGRVGSTSWDSVYGDVRVNSNPAAISTAAAPQPANPTARSDSGNRPATDASPAASPQGAPATRATSLPSLADEEARRAQREVERVANLARLTELVPNLKAPDWITAGKVVKGDQTIIPASGTGATLKDAYDAAVVSGQRELLKQAGIPAARVVIGRGAYQRIPDGPGFTWQVFLEAVGVGGTGPLPILKPPAPSDKPPVDLIGE
jgi:hypothetical protein